MVYIDVVTRFRGPVIPIVTQRYSSKLPSVFIACEWSSMMASLDGWKSRLRNNDTHWRSIAA